MLIVCQTTFTKMGGLIKELLNNWSEVNLFTRPRRFGKSLNMSMLRYFFEIGTDTKLFDGLEITKETELCSEYMGKFPVVSVSLKGIEGSSFSDAKEMLICIIKAEFKRHSYLLESNRLSESDKADLQKLLNNMSDSDIKNSLWLLAQMLFKHYDKKVILLIDEYDVPLAKAFDYGYYSDIPLLLKSTNPKKSSNTESLAIRNAVRS